MTFISALNIFTSILALIAILLTVLLVFKKKLFLHSGIFFTITQLLLLLVAVSNVFEHLHISKIIDSYEEYFEVLIIPFFLLFLYSITSHNDIRRRKQKELELEHALQERELLIRELHHRVKNNLQIVASLLLMQTKSIHDKDLNNFLYSTMNRVIAMSTLHKELYQSQDFSKIDMREYLDAIIGHLREIYENYNDKIEYDISISNIYVDIAAAIPCGLIVNEVVTNSILHGFNNRVKAKITIKVTQQPGKTLVMILADNGVGMSHDAQSSHGLGLQLIEMLVLQINGTLHVERDQGTKYIISF